MSQVGAISGFTNTRLLSPVAIQGVTQAPIGSYEYIDWWNTQRKYCLEGYSAAGTSITGLHYYYLNFWSIRKKISKNQVGGTSRKSLAPPDFIDIDHDFFWELQYAREAGEDFMLWKRRQIGGTEKMGAMAAYEFEMFPHSHTIITAGEEKYCERLFRAARRGLDRHAGGEFYKARQGINTQDHLVASYFVKVNEVWQERGYFSQVQHIVAKDPQALVGTTASLIIYEEAGLFKNLVSTKMYTDQSLAERDQKTGMSIILGTGGETNETGRGKSSVHEAEEIFSNPERYNVRSYENTWDEFEPLSPSSGNVLSSDGKRRRVAYFVPGWKFLVIDSDGNSLKKESLEELDRRRARVKGNPQALLKEITQMPKTPRESFMRPEGNEFNTEKLHQQYRLIMGYEENRNKVRVGNIDWILDAEGRVSGAKWLDDPRGKFRMVEPPVTDNTTAKVFKDAYVGGVDSYDRDKTSDPNKGSFGSCYIGKTFTHSGDTSYVLKVCSYTDRPKTSEDFYEACAKMAVLYGWCKLLVEYSNLRILDWMKNNRFERLLAERPEVVYANVQNSGMQNKYGVDPQTKPYWITTLADHLQNGGIERLADPEDIDELIRYRGEVNSDRTIAMSLVAVHMKQVEQAMINRNIAKVSTQRRPRHLFHPFVDEDNDLYEEIVIP